MRPFGSYRAVLPGMAEARRPPDGGIQLIPGQISGLVGWRSLEPLGMGNLLAGGGRRLFVFFRGVGWLTQALGHRECHGGLLFYLKEKLLKTPPVGAGTR